MPSHAVQVVPWEQYLLVLARLDALEKSVAELERNQSEWVSQKEAMKITGFKRCEGLKSARERAGSLIIVKKEGKNNQTPMYLRASLIAYNESKVRRPRVPSVALHPKAN